MDKTCNATVVFEVRVDVQSIKLKEKRESHLLDAGNLS